MQEPRKTRYTRRIPAQDYLCLGVSGEEWTGAGTGGGHVLLSVPHPRWQEERERYNLGFKEHAVTYSYIHVLEKGKEGT